MEALCTGFRLGGGGGRETCRLRSLRSRKAAYMALRAVDEVDVVGGGHCVAADLAAAGYRRSGK